MWEVIGTMRDFAPDGFDVDEAVAELLDGSGGLRFPQCHTRRPRRWRMFVHG